MLKTISYALLLIITGFFAAPYLFTSSFIRNFTGGNETNSKSFYPSVFELSQEDKIWIENQIKQMPLKYKVAQMLSVLVPANTTLNSPDFQKVLKYVDTLKVGGVIFSRNNIQSQIQITNKLQDISDIPLLISADFENGLGMRFSESVDFPYNMAIAAAGDIDLVYQMGKLISEEAKSIGVYQNFAPVADMNTNHLNPVINVRSFSDDKEIVARYVSAFILGSKQSRTITTAKHFPGHGNTDTDSHLDLPKINLDRLNLANNELIPFIQAIKAGVQSIMIGHISVPSIEPNTELPASLSYKIVTDLLQNELGFDGLIITDAMDMSAITKYYSDEEAAVLAVLAGNDMILMPRDAEAAINSITAEVLDGKISEGRINSSVRKILSAKRWLQLYKNKFVDPIKAEKVIKTNKHFLLANEIAEKSITLVKDENNIIPLNPAMVQRTTAIFITNSSSGKFFFENLIDENFGYVNKIFLNPKSDLKEYSKAMNIAQNSDLIIIPSFIKVRPEQSDNFEDNFNFINNILELDKPAILISMGDPYLLSYFPHAETYLCSYGNTEVSQRAMMNALLGKIPVQGTLPVSISDTEFDLKSGKFVEQRELDFIPYDQFFYNLSSVDAEMQNGIKNKVFPGGVLLVGKRGKVIFHKPFGRFTYEKSSLLMSNETRFDLSSLTQTVATKTAAMFLYDEEKLNLNSPVSYYLPEFANNGKENITVRDLLLNHSGLPGNINSDINVSRESFINSVLNIKAEKSFSISYLNMIVLQLIIEKLTGKNLDLYLKEKLLNPLNMDKTLYNPPAEFWQQTAPTSEISESNTSMSYDNLTFIMNGVSGHSGLFSAGKDLAVFAQLILQNGNYNNKQWIKPSTIQEFLFSPSFIEVSADNKSLLFTGDTGTSVYINPEKEIFIILLTNSIYPDGNEKRINEFRTKLQELILSKLEY